MSVLRAVKKADLASEADRATTLLRKKIVKEVCRPSKEQVLVVFSDGTYFYIAAEPGRTQELSICGGPPEDDRAQTRET